ncbi:MazG nucleotide pyrophosphohydrolase domain-containing protein [Micrococcus antarcticus]|uniref:MazG nucleotide pyrophosphohydrolase domain-containing protein n=1 Tax=Micrococcus antarcticus TaxID=86171 RepID=UPI00262C64E7|nr:MazG nucleotide pyrophosphohydrolase domain-containing protein [uncultured Micrococcus sp.]
MSEAVDRLVGVVEALRDHCPWTAALTHADLTEHLVEEAYEAVAEIESRDAESWADTAARRADGSYAALAGEMGDVLFQVVLHAAVSRAPGAPTAAAGFRLDDAADALAAKMIRRNPLVLTPEGGLRSAEERAAVTPEAVELAWERVKAAERAAAARAASSLRDDGESGAGASSAGDAAVSFGDIPDRLPALAAAAMIADRAARQPEDPLRRHAPLAPAEHAGADVADVAGWADEAELGRELFALVRRARAAGLDPERALRALTVRVRAGEWDALSAAPDAG